MSIKTELKRLYTALCGGTTTKDGTAAIIGDIADNYTDGGGSALPAVTAGDNGKFLTVFNGAWDKSVAPLKDQVIVAELNESGETWGLVDGTPTDLITAFNNKIPVFILVGGAETLVPVLSVDAEDESITAAMSAERDGSITSFGVSYNNGAWTVEITQTTYVPLVIDGTFDYQANTVTIAQTLEEIYEAYAAGRSVYIDSPFGRIPCVNAQSNTATFTLVVSMGGASVQLVGALFTNGSQTGEYYEYNLTTQ